MVAKRFFKLLASTPPPEGMRPYLTEATPDFNIVRQGQFLFLPPSLDASS